MPDKASTCDAQHIAAAAGHLHPGARKAACASPIWMRTTMMIMNSWQPELCREINSGVIFVPAEIVGRSRPSSHSVPIVGPRRKIRRQHLVRNLVAAGLVSAVALAGVLAATYYSIEAEQDAGYKLVCSTVGFGKYAHSECHWEKL